jgi:Sulfotransferase family
MKVVRFLQLLFKQGSLRLKRVDFDDERSRTLDFSQLPIPVPAKKVESRIKAFLMRNSLGYSLLANLAYLKNARRMNVMYFVSDSHQVVYVRLLKCASTSMLREFLPLVDNRLKDTHFSDQQLDVLGFYYVKKVIPKGQDRYKKFALVRNPFQRIVSVYLDLFDPASSTFTYSAYCFGILTANMSFKVFIKTIGQIPTLLLGPHFSPQSYILENASALENIQVFRIEKDAEALEKFLQPYGLSLPHLNKHAVSYDYRSYYDAETFSIVERLYAGDVKRFGYEEDYRLLQQYVNH